MFSIGFRLFYTFEVVFLVQLDAGFSTCLKLLRFDNVRLLRLFLGYFGKKWDVSGCVTFDVVLNVSIVVLFFCVVGKFCVVFALFEVVFLIVLCCRQLCCVCFHGFLLCF